MKDKILMGTTYLMVTLLFTAGSLLDSCSVLPYILCGLSLAWLALFTVVNKEVVSKW